MRKAMKNQILWAWCGIVAFAVCIPYTAIPVEAQPLLENPYQNHPYWYKGQVHAHSTQSDGDESPSSVLDFYRKYGYHFVSLTDHYVGYDASFCAEIHNLSRNMKAGILHMPGMENGDTDPEHLLAIGITRKDSRCGPPCDTWPNQLRIDHVAAQGAISVIAHPYGEYAWDDLELLDSLSGFHGIEIDNSKRERRLWDILLSLGKPVWGFATDDCHGYELCNRGWIVVNSSMGPPEKVLGALVSFVPPADIQLRQHLRADLIRNILAGNFYAVARDKGGAGSDIGPKIEKILVQDDEIFVETDRDDSLISIIGNGGESLGGTKGRSFSYRITGSEVYVRVEVRQVRNGVRFTAYSQPLFAQDHKVPWPAGAGMLQGTVTGFGGRPLRSAAKMKFTSSGGFDLGVRIETTESGSYSVRLLPEWYRVTIEPTGKDAYLSGPLSGGPIGVQRLKTVTRDFQLPKAKKPPEKGDQPKPRGREERDN